MFLGRVEEVSHEGGLLVSYSGACPALGSVMVDSNETYIGKVDGVVGNLKNSLVHVAHLDRKSNPNDMIGLEITIRTKRNRDNNRREDTRRGRSDRRGNDRRERNSRGDRARRNDDFSSRDNRRGNNERRQRDNRGRRENRRDNKGTHSNNDWTCSECNNVNFSFRTECNRCGAPKGRGGQRNRSWKGDDRRPGDRREAPKPRPGDWICPKCGKSNFAKRNECFSCGHSKRVGGPKTRGHFRKLKDPPPLHSAKYGRGKRRDNR